MSSIRRFVLLALVSVASVFAAGSVLTGCTSQPVAYTSAATPLSDNLMADFDRYVAAEPDATSKSEGMALSGTFRTAIVSGNAKTAASKWFGTGNIRSRLLDYWSADPKFQSPGGVELMQIKVHNVEAFDYILTVGDTQQSGTGK